MQQNPVKPNQCALCARDVDLQFHHLIPRKVHRRKRFQKQFTKEQLGHGIYVCRSCHRAVHRFFDEMTLAQDFNTREKLLVEERIQRHIEWAKKQKSA